MRTREWFNIGQFMQAISHLSIDEQIDALWGKYFEQLNSQIVTKDSLERARIDVALNRPVDPEWRRKAYIACRTYGLHILQIQFSINRLKRARHVSNVRNARFVANAKRILDAELINSIESADVQK